MKLRILLALFEWHLLYKLLQFTYEIQWNGNRIKERLKKNLFLYILY